MISWTKTYIHIATYGRKNGGSKAAPSEVLQCLSAAQSNAQSRFLEDSLLEAWKPFPVLHEMRLLMYIPFEAGISSQVPGASN